MIRFVIFLFLIACTEEKKSTGTEVQEILSKEMSKIQVCYTTEVNKTKNRNKGMAVLAFQISADGSVADAEVQSNNLNLSDEAKNCLINILKPLKFSLPVKGSTVKIQQPIELSVN